MKAEGSGKPQWSRWPGIGYALPTQAWVGPHHCSVGTGIARAGIDALIELAGGKRLRGRDGSLLCGHTSGLFPLPMRQL